MYLFCSSYYLQKDRDRWLIHSDMEEFIQTQKLVGYTVWALKSDM